MLGSIISAGAGIIGGLLGKKSSDKATAATKEMAAANIAHQKEFAQHGIRWRVDDARAAGIHPIYALGASTPSFAPVSAAFSGDTSLPNALASAGQDIGRAVNATRSQGERMTAFTKTAQALTLEKMSLENEVLRSEVASKVGRLVQQSNPPMPSPADSWLIPGHPQSGPLVTNKPLERTPGDPRAPGQEGGAITDVGHARTAKGLFPVPSENVKQRIEDNFYQETMHFIRNNLLPMLSPAFNAPPHPPAKGKAWVYDPVYGYKQVPDRKINRFLRMKGNFYGSSSKKRTPFYEASP